MKYASLTFLLCWLCCYPCFAQRLDVPQGDQDWPYRDKARIQRYSQTRALEPDTLDISIASPFFDDFNYSGPLPDSNRWFISDNNFDAPSVNASLAINPPTLGSACFDGINRFNEPYDINSLSRGLCDQLVSHYLDLSGFGPQDNVWLSFAIQPQGRGDAPEPSDSFFVYFRVPDAGIERKVYSRGGTDVHGFEQISVPIDQSEYFETRFQLIFESFGSQNGQLDLWHLDYVYLAPGRTANDTIFDDYAPVELQGGPLGKFSAVPIQQYNQQGNLHQSFQLRSYNLNTSNYAVASVASISDPVGGNPFGGFSSQSVVLPLTGLNRLSEVYNPFTQPFMASPGVVELEIDLMAEDAITSNNLFQRQYRIDSILAYDDGQAEQSFGINKPWGVANAFYSPTEDSIRAVWISFVPTINFNSITTQLTYMEEASFRLTIWDDPNPDSILVQQIGGSKVQYGDQVNHFHRYLLSDPVAVKDSFWVGIVQVSTEPIGVGWDKNYPGKDLIWFDNSGSWEPLDIEGSLMIRPEFQISASMPASIESSPELAGVSIFPNPFEGVGELRLRRTTGSSTGPYQGRLYDMQGRIVTEVKLDRLQNIASIPLPSDLQPGIYLWQHQIGKEAYLYTEKLIIR